MGEIVILEDSRIQGFKGSRVRAAIYVHPFIMVAFLFIGLFTLGIGRADAQSIVNPDMLSSKLQPKQVRWGCLVCHGDPKLAKVTKEGERPLFVDPEIIGNSVHKKIACLDCHQDFSYSGHPPEVPDDFRKTAGLACRNCHRYQRFLYDKSIHYERATAGSKKGPTCGSCHGNHGIQFLSKERTDAEYKKEFRSSGGKEICGKCHENRFRSYNDYYHGRAYKMKAVDAPACWDCHANHRVLPKENKSSTIHEDNLPETCNRCHQGATKFFTQYAPMMHGFGERWSKNPVISFVSNILGLQPKVEKSDEPTEKIGMFAKIRNWFGGILSNFFPDSLRPRKEDSS